MAPNIGEIGRAALEAAWPRPDQSHPRPRVWGTGRAVPQHLPGWSYGKPAASQGSKGWEVFAGHGLSLGV